MNLRTLIFLAPFWVPVAYAGWQSLPAYKEYFDVQKSIKTLADRNLGQASAYRAAFTDEVRNKGYAVDPVALQILGTASSGQTLTLQYEKVVPMIGVVSLLLDFEVSVPVQGQQ